MPCYSPVDVYRIPASDTHPNGGISFIPTKAMGDLNMQVPCGKCIGCRLERSRQWAIRCTHENMMHDQSCFITLTYDDDNLPPSMSLQRDHIQKFFKRLRRQTSKKIRNFYAGEYGETTQRPHYHALVFGWEPQDGEQITDGDDPIYESQQLTKIWGFGFASYGLVTFESAAYVARYTTKKVNGPMAHEHYERINPETGEIYQLEPEFMGCSRRPGIGTTFLEKYGKGIYEKDRVVLRGMPMRPPRYYDKWASEKLPDLWKTVKRKRAARQRENMPIYQDETSDYYKKSYNCFKAKVTIQAKMAKQRNEQRV